MDCSTSPDTTHTSTEGYSKRISEWRTGVLETPSYFQFSYLFERRKLRTDKIIIRASYTIYGDIVTEERSIGVVMQYFAKAEVAAIQITDGEIKVGDTLRIKGATTEFTQKIDSMQIDRASVPIAKAGQSVGIKVKERVREHDRVFLVVG